MLRFAFVFLVSAIVVTGCVSIPNGPSVMVLPASGVSFEQFRYDDAICRQFAFSQVGGISSNQAAINSGVISAATGTALGAAAGAALGGGRGAAIGAGSGLVAGSVVGSDTARSAMYAGQAHYDMAYIQCMYTKGHRVPVYGQFMEGESPRTQIPDSSIPPPPLGSPPPPPLN